MGAAKDFFLRLGRASSMAADLALHNEEIGCHRGSWVGAESALRLQSARLGTSKRRCHGNKRTPQIKLECFISPIDSSPRFQGASNLLHWAIRESPEYLPSAIFVSRTIPESSWLGRPVSQPNREAISSPAF